MNLHVTRQKEAALEKEKYCKEVYDKNETLRRQRYHPLQGLCWYPSLSSFEELISDQLGTPSGWWATDICQFEVHEIPSALRTRGLPSGSCEGTISIRHPPVLWVLLILMLCDTLLKIEIHAVTQIMHTRAVLRMGAMPRIHAEFAMLVAHAPKPLLRHEVTWVMHPPPPPPMGAAKGKQSDTEALCHPPPPGSWGPEGSSRLKPSFHLAAHVLWRSPCQWPLAMLG